MNERRHRVSAFVGRSPRNMGKMKMEEHYRRRKRNNSNSIRFCFYSIRFCFFVVHLKICHTEHSCYSEIENVKRPHLALFSIENPYLAQKKEYASSLLRSLFVIFTNQADPDGRPPGNRRRKHPCASHRLEPAGTNSEAQDGSAIFSFFAMLRIYY